MTIGLLSCLEKQNLIKPSVFPPNEFNESDLFGTWQEDGAVDSSETLILSPNYKFHQIFDFSKINYHAESDGSWEVIKRDNGCLYLYLYGMKYYYQDLVLTNNGNYWQSGVKAGKPEKYWDECSDSIVEMPNMVILFISQHPEYPKNIILRHMATQRDIVDIFFFLSDQ